MGQLEDLIFRAAPGKWTLYRCLKCWCAYLDPRPDLATIGMAYLNYYTHASDAHTTKAGRIRVAIANSLRNRLFGSSLTPSMPWGWLVASINRRKAYSVRMEGRGLDRLLGTTGLILDVGCGNGSFLSMAKSAGWQCFGVEPDPEAVRVAEADGATILGADVSELRGRHVDHFDVITLSHVIEHIHDPSSLLRDCWTMLKPGGLFWIETPNIDAVGYEMYTRAWRGLEPPRHLMIFNGQTLISSLKSAGFQEPAVVPPRDVVGIIFPQSASVAAGHSLNADTASLSKQAQKALRSNMRKARRITRTSPERAEFITAIAFKR